MARLKSFMVGACLTASAAALFGILAGMVLGSPDLARAGMVIGVVGLAGMAGLLDK